MPPGALARTWAGTGLALALVAGCALDRVGLAMGGAGADGGTDAGGGDAGLPRDAGADAAPADAAGPGDAGAPDAGLPDTGAPDAGLPDTGAPDAGPSDAGPPDTGPPDAGPPSCDDQYGGAAGYMLCDERATECEFVSRLDGVRTCRTTCAALGGRCIDAYRNELPFPPCERQGTPIGCDQLHVDDICICSRGP